MIIEYKFQIPSAEQALQLYKDSGIYNKQWTLERMKLTLQNSSILLCSYNESRLVGIARGITDFHWIAHLSHLAVHPDYQGQGIGKELIKKINQRLGNGVALMVHSDPKAKKFYENLGFEIYDDVYRIPRRT